MIFSVLPERRETGFRFAKLFFGRYKGKVIWACLNINYTLSVSVDIQFTKLSLGYIAIISQTVK